MTAERMEELARKCEAESDSDTLTQADLRDLARCARAWAKVEAQLHRLGGSSVSLIVGYSGVFYSSFHGKAVAPTAIEAVEAAEVKG